MSFDAKTAISLSPYPAMCPWLHVTTLLSTGVSRLTVTHNDVTDSFEVEDLAANFADAFNRALRLKHAMVTAEKVAQALDELAWPDASDAA